MRKEVSNFLSADGVSKIHVVTWTPDQGEPVAVLQLIHGMVEYIERYEPFARYLTDQGFAVVGHDHIGHGSSVSDSSQWGVMQGRHPSDVMVEDIYRNYCLIEEAYPQLPHFILGHSMGSYMLRKFLSVKAKDISRCSGAIIMGTGTEKDATIAMGRALIAVMALVKGWDYRSKFAAGLMYGPAYKEFDTNGSQPEKSWLTKDTEIVKSYYVDPACSYIFSLSGFKGLLEATAFDNRQTNIDRIPKKLPILFASGAQDPVGNLGKGVREAYNKFQRAGITDLNIKLYEGDRHEILNELDRKQVYQDLYEWMKERM